MRPVSLSPTASIDGMEVVYAADQPEYQPLPVWRWPDGTLITRWRLTWRERIRALLGGDLYLQVMTFGNPLQPLYPTWERTEVVNETSDPEPAP